VNKANFLYWFMVFSIALFIGITIWGSMRSPRVTCDKPNRCILVLRGKAYLILKAVQIRDLGY